MKYFQTRNSVEFLFNFLEQAPTSEDNFYLKFSNVTSIVNFSSKTSLRRMNLPFHSLILLRPGWFHRIVVNIPRVRTIHSLGYMVASYKVYITRNPISLLARHRLQVSPFCKNYPTFRRHNYRSAKGVRSRSLGSKEKALLPWMCVVEESNYSVDCMSFLCKFQYPTLPRASSATSLITSYIQKGILLLTIFTLFLPTIIAGTELFSAGLTEDTRI